MVTGESRVFQDLMRLKPDDLTPNAWAVKAGVSRTVWADMRRHGNPSRRTLEKLLVVAGSSIAEFEALRVGDAPSQGAAEAGSQLRDVRRRQWTGPTLPTLPLLGSVFGGEWKNGDGAVELIEIRDSQILDRLPRPPTLAGDLQAYAITIVGDSMWPRFRPGRRVAVSPNAPVAIGDDVLVQLVPDRKSHGERTAVMVKELVRRSGNEVELRQFNPDLCFRVRTGEIGAIHKVMGELI